jgi:MoxR-like ATPase
MSSRADLERELAEIERAGRAISEQIGARIVGQARVVEELLVALFADGHVLLEGAPGLGKTTLVRELARTLELDFKRLQCTPDLMPADVLGTRILDEDEHGARRFRFEKGPVFAHVLLADEINRATPRTQAALLEAMAERQVTVFGETLVLEPPFLVVATQNPIEMEGTYPLPEAQLDRFLLKIEIARPPLAEMEAILAKTTGTETAGAARVLTRERLLRLRALVREVPISSDAIALVARLVSATHPADELAGEKVRRFVRYGASPRGGQALILAAKARALLNGRLHVSGDDLERLASAALRHRLILNYEGEAAETSVDEIVREAFERARPR